MPFASLSKGQLGRLHQSNGSTNLWHETPSRAADLEERPRTLTQPPGSPGANSAGFLVFANLSLLLWQILQRLSRFAEANSGIQMFMALTTSAKTNKKLAASSTTLARH